MSAVLISPDNCDYRAEGNAGIVIRLLKEDKVLRLKKQDDVGFGTPTAQDALTELEDQIKITENVFKKILGKAFVHCPLIVFLHAEEIKMLNQVISKFRPENRRHKSVKEKDTYVVMLPDFCCLPSSLKLMPSQGPTLSIEIKPKQGFVKAEYLHGSSSALLIPLCRCCMMKRHKFKCGMISYRSGYCPTDLFSGCYTRMMHALKMLCKTPQNNFRIFKDQKLVYSEEKETKLWDLLSDFFVGAETSRFTILLCDLIIQALMKPFPDGIYKSQVLNSPKKYSQDCINAHKVCTEKDPCHILPKFSVLERILRCQLLDDLNIVDVYQLYLQVKDKDGSSDSIGCYSRSEIPPYVGELRRNAKETQYKYASRKVWEFLMALTARDCSIMIVLRRLIGSPDLTQMQNVISDELGNLYTFSISIADLDAKAKSKIEKLYKETAYILESFDA